MKKTRANIRVKGVVQGVGFRPFIHRQMTQYALAGWIRNTSEGVEIEAEGDEVSLDQFVRELRTGAPKLASIETVQVEKFEELKGYREFSIIGSKTMTMRNTLVSPDVGICDDCLRELFDKNDRRYHYPFINCTNCGPRFTIIKDIPYDRCKTTMAPFAMCPDCEAEYRDIANRRYHAQPDCCSVCGPELFFADANGNRMDGDPVSLAAECLWRGEVVAVKGLGGIHLACRCDDPAVVKKLRMRKRRDEKPFAVMCRDLETVERYCELSAEETAALTGYRRPIVLLKKKDKNALSHLSENQYVGVMLPYTPVHHLLFTVSPDCLVMTSANLSDTPIVIKNEEAMEKLRGIADGFLLNNREIENRCDDSLLWIVRGREYPVRRSRGYVPFPVTLENGMGQTLACGAEQKAAFSVSKRDHVFQSPHIGDLKNAETLENYESQIALFERLFDIKPERIVCDLHPDYLSTVYAETRAKRDGIPLLRVQHHHAHMASCMADNKLEGPCIGVIWDGTGYGTDGTAWGGEFLTGDYAAFQRKGSLRSMRLPGADRAVKELWRTGTALLLDAGIDPEVFFLNKNAKSVEAMISADINCPRSTSMGRLFDGVCAIIGIKQTASYEGQGAVLLEAASVEDCDRRYPYEIVREHGRYVFDYRMMIRAICQEKREGIPVGILAAAFMNTVIGMAEEMCGFIRKETGLNRVVFSGGTFQNMYMLKRLFQGLQEDGFEVFCHERVATNDEGVSFGQTAIAEKGGGAYVSCGTPEDYRN